MDVRVEATITVDLAEVINHNLEGFLDLISERAGYPLLMDIHYEVVSVDGDTLTLKVSGENGDIEEDTDGKK